MDTERKLTVRDLQKMKQASEKIVAITAYDALFARIVDEAGFQLILVGDSMGNTVLGYSNTIPVTLEQSLMLTAAVCRGAHHAMVIGDMPFMSYQASQDDAVLNASRYLKECGADGVKLEGGQCVYDIIRRFVSTGIPVMGHVGLLPQSVLREGGYRIHGRHDEAKAVMEDALAVEEAGAFSVVLEGVPASLAADITARLKIPTIGIGAGAGCDGQIQVLTDVLGLGGAFLPRHARRFANLAEVASGALKTYADEVRQGTFPAECNSVK